MLLMITIIVSSVAITVNSVSSNQDRLYDAGRELFAKMQFAMDESLMQQRLIGFRVETDSTEISSYDWHYYIDERWQLLEEPLNAITLPEDIVVELSIDDELLETLLEKTLNDQSEEGAAPPSILFFPDSNVSDFQLILALKGDDEQEPYQIYIDERGQLTNSLIDTSNKGAQ